VGTGLDGSQYLKVFTVWHGCCVARKSWWNVLWTDKCKANKLYSPFTPRPVPNQSDPYV